MVRSEEWSIVFRFLNIYCVFSPKISSLGNLVYEKTVFEKWGQFQAPLLTIVYTQKHASIASFRRHSSLSHSILHVVWRNRTVLKSCSHNLQLQLTTNNLQRGRNWPIFKVFYTYLQRIWHPFFDLEALLPRSRGTFTKALLQFSSTLKFYCVILYICGILMLKEETRKKGKYDARKIILSW